MNRRAFICGLEGLTLSDAERRFLDLSRPVGLILFGRNISEPAQVKTLIQEARAAAGAVHSQDAFFVAIDQEGGRVQRLRPPHWRAFPCGAAFAKAFPGDTPRAAEAAYLCTRLIAEDLSALGINVNCAPVLDVPIATADKIIGDRAYGVDTGTVTHIGGRVADGLLDGGVLPVIKHIPGHGRALADSHLALPTIDAPLDVLKALDFAPFTALRHLPLAMTAHVVLSSIDTRAPVTVSKRAIGEVVRGMIGFDGLLMTDDLSMKALSGGLFARTEAAFAAGCDIALHCNGDLNEMKEVARASPILEGQALVRTQTAYAQLKAPTHYDSEAAEQALAEVLAVVA